METGSITGRFYFTSPKTGKVWCIEPIGDSHVKWGDLNPATGKVEGNYGQKYAGSVDEKDSIITKENGYENIHYSGIGSDPISYINKLEENL